MVVRGNVAADSVVFARNEYSAKSGQTDPLVVIRGIVAAYSVGVGRGQKDADVKVPDSRILYRDLVSHIKINPVPCIAASCYRMTIAVKGYEVAIYLYCSG